MTPHIGAAPGDIAETVLMPGDPKRAQWAAERFLEEPKLINNVRGMLGFTGHWKGQPVTFHGSGMGMPSLSIYAHELITHYGAKRLIRIGSCGAFQAHLPLGSMIAALSASSISTPSSTIFRELNFAASASFSLLEKAVQLARSREKEMHVGGVFSSDVFYDERPDLSDVLQRHGVLGVEMEAAELYNVAARHNVEALALLTVSDQLVTGEKLSAQARENGFTDMVELALDAALK